MLTQPQVLLNSRSSATKKSSRKTWATTSSCIPHVSGSLWHKARSSEESSRGSAIAEMLRYLKELNPSVQGVADTQVSSGAAAAGRADSAESIDPDLELARLLFTIHHRHLLEYRPVGRSADR